MMVTRIVTLAGDPEQEARLAGLLAARGDVELILRCVDRAELLGSVRGAALDAVVSVGAPLWFDGQCAKEAAARDVRVVGLTDDPLHVDRLMSLGATILPVNSDVDQVLDAMSEPIPYIPSSANSSAVRGDLVAVWGPKGAPGRTRIAVELAFQLAETEPGTLLVDADPYGGDILQLLGILEELPTVVWASRLAAKGDLCATLLQSEVRRASKSGPMLLPGIPRADLWAEVSDFGWHALLALARDSFRFTVFDVGFCLEPDASHFNDDEGRNRMARATVTRADHVVAVCRGDVVGVKNFIWSFPQLAELADVDDILVVVNRSARSQEQETGKLLRRYIGKRPVAYIPDRPAPLMKAVRAGVSVAGLDPEREISSTMRLLAEAVGGRVKSRGLLARAAGQR
jgi:MinD-like ATPase involved in chromosome partitioning or flagellar assembly